jgi:hypothetical protein
VADPTPSPVIEDSCVSQEAVEGSCMKSAECCGSMKCSKEGNKNKRFCYRKEVMCRNSLAVDGEETTNKIEYH